MTQKTSLLKYVMSIMLVMLGFTSQAQNPTYDMYITNQSQVDSKTYQFDVYVLRTGTVALEMAGIQLGIGIDTSITNGGTLTFGFVSGSSELGTALVPQTFIVGGAFYSANGLVYRSLNQTARAAPGAGNGTIISATKTGCTAPGTRIGTYRLTNTRDFRSASSAKHIFNVTNAAQRTVTAVTCYVNGVNVTAVGTLYNYNTSSTCDQNLSLNGCAVSAGVSTNAVVCYGQSSGSATVTLSGLGSSSTGTYKLDDGASVSYSSNPFTVSGLSAGSHTIAVTTTGLCEASTGSFTVEGPSGPAVSSTTESACTSYLWNGTTYTASGVYTFNTTSGAGCDSTATLNLTINQNASGEVIESVCAAALPYSWNGSSYTAGGVYTYNTTTVNGCDSVVTLVLTVKAASSSLTVASACVSEGAYEWNGSSYTASGTYSYTTTNAAGCDSVAVLNLSVTSTKPTVSPAITQVLISNLCGARKYRFSAATTANATGYEWILPTSVGGESGVTLDSGDAAYSRVIVLTFASNRASISTDSIKVRAYSGCGVTAYKGAKLSNAALLVPATPTAIAITPLITNECGNRLYRYSVPSLPAGTATTGAATGYVWELVGGLSASATIDSGDVNGQKIVVRFSSNAAALTGDSIKFYYTSGCGNSLTKAAKLTNTAIVVPAAPTAIAITPLITNVCGNRVYRYSVPALPAASATAGAATGYVWEFVGSMSEYATIDSGDVNGQKIVVSFSSNAAAATGDSIKFYYTSGCGNSLTKAAKLTNTALKEPAAPAATGVKITAIQTNVCGARKYRYSAPALPAATTTTGAATGYVWDFVGSLQSTMTVDSGDLNSQIFTVTFTSNAAAGLDSVRMYYTSDCGNSLRRAAKLSNTLLSAPAAAAATGVTITPIQTNVCAARKYRYSAPNLPAATATTGAASGYVWDFAGSLQQTMTIDSGDVNSQRFTVTFTSNAAAGLDSVRMFYTSAGCGNSARRAVKLSNTLLSAPAAATAVTITSIQTNVCAARKYRYSAPNLPAATATTGAASGYVWDVIGSLASTMTVDSGTLTSQRFTVTFTSNAAAGLDSVRVLYTTAGCGNSARKAAKLANTLLGAPAAPATVTIQQVLPDVCYARKYRYIAPAVLPGATATAGAANGYLWSAPTGTVGSTGTIDSGEVTSRIITVTYTSNAAAGTGDSIRLRYTSNGCGNGVIKAQKLSNLIKTGCVPPITKNTSTSRVPATLQTSMEVKVYPNPTTTQFNVQVKSSGTEEAVVRVLDVTGRFIKSVKVSSNSNVNLGSDLKAGAYMLEVRQGKEVKTVRVMKF